MDLINLVKFHRDEFISRNKQFIYITTYNICKRKLEWENDDELSISLIAFNKACDMYNEKKGNFFSFSRLIIRNALIDYFRKNSKEMFLSFNNDEESEEQLYNESSITSFEIETENKNRAEEILDFTQEIKAYKLDLENLINSSPSHKDAKNRLLNIAFVCSNEEIILEYIHKNKMLPIKQISILTNTKVKLLEKWRKYILALILIISNNNYVYIKSYLNIKVGEQQHDT